MCRRIHASLILLVLTACSSQELSYTDEMIGDVRHVHNLAPLHGEDPRINLEFVCTIGQSDSDDDRYLLFYPIDAAADGEGNIFILDSRRPAIRKYDNEGTHIVDFGTEGSGPGEFRSSICMDMDSDYNLYLSDMDNVRLNVFASDGSYRKGITLGNFFHFFCILSTGEIAGFDLSYEEDPPKVGRLLNRDGNFSSTFCEAIREGERFMTFLVNQCEIESDSEDNIYISFNHFNRIDKFSPDGTLLMRVDRPLNFEVKHKMQMGTYEREGEYVEIPDPVLTHVSDWIGIDDQDRLWVLTFNAQPEETGSASALMSDHTIMQFDVFNSEGVLLCRLPVPVQMSRFRVYGDWMLILDPYGEVCVHMFRISG